MLQIIVLQWPVNSDIFNDCSVFWGMNLYVSDSAKFYFAGWHCQGGTA